ncbi:class I SAM-dependent methyltransferase [Amycolatopsis sp. NPDC003676]
MPTQPDLAEEPPLSEEEVYAGIGDYTPGFLASADFLILGIFFPVVWRCPERIFVRLYDRNIGARHLDIGPGTGYPLNRCWRVEPPARLALVDYSENVLRRCAKKLARYEPTLHLQNAMEPLEIEPETFDSAAVNLVLHCMPGSVRRKARVFDHVLPYLAPGGRLFGATVLGHGPGVKHSWLARKALTALNEDHSMHNLDDTLPRWEQELAARFGAYRIAVHGSVALFEAVAPDRKPGDHGA